MDRPIELPLNITDETREGLQTLGLSDEEMQPFMDDVMRMLEERQNDPRTQNYMMRLDTKSLIETEGEFNFVKERGIPYQIISYGHAVELLRKADAERRKKLKKKRQRKAAKKARRR